MALPNWGADMVERFSRAWGVAKMCWRVLLLDKEMLVFPLLSLLVCGLLLAGFVGPYLANDRFDALFSLVAVMDEEGNINPVAIAIDFAIYFIAYFVMIFFNAALVACARIRFAGGDPTVMDGLRAAFARLPTLFAWALVTSIVGFILNKISEHQKGIGGFVAALVGAGWAIASFFVVPVLVADNLGPIDALKKSASIVKKTWGELLVTEIGLSALSVLIIVPAFAIGFAGMILFEGNPALSVPILVLLVLWVFVASLIYSTLSTILRTAYFIYATEGRVPDQFDRDVIEKPAIRGGKAS